MCAASAYIKTPPSVPSKRPGPASASPPAPRHSLVELLDQVVGHVASRGHVLQTLLHGGTRLGLVRLGEVRRLGHRIHVNVRTLTDGAKMRERSGTWQGQLKRRISRPISSIGNVEPLVYSNSRTVIITKIHMHT